MEENINELIINKIIDSEFFYELSTKTDDYGDPILRKLLNKIDCAKNIAEVLELDITAIKVILISIDISYPCYGEIGEEFLESNDKSFSKILYMQKILKAILQEFDNNDINKICESIKNVINNSPKTEEEKLAKIINNLFDELDIIQKGEIRGLLVGEFIGNVIKDRKITEINLLNGRDSLEKRVKRKLDKEKTLETLEKAKQYYMENYEEIPREFKDSFIEFTREQIVAYYITTKTQRKIEEIV